MERRPEGKREALLEARDYRGPTEGSDGAERCWRFKTVSELELTRISDGLDMRSERNGRRIQGVRKITRILRHTQLFKSLFRRVMWILRQEVRASGLFWAPSPHRDT